MRHRLVVIALAALWWAPASASPGDVVVPAHRTRDGHYVPPNVPPLSAGTRLARRPSRGLRPHRLIHARPAAPAIVQAHSGAR